MIRKGIIYLFICLPFLCKSQMFKDFQKQDLLVNRLQNKEFKEMNSQQLTQVLLHELWNERDSLISSNTYPQAETLYIQYYYAISALALSKSIVNQLDKQKPWFVLADSIFSQIRLPTRDELKIQPYALKYIHAYLDHKTLELFWETKQKNQIEGINFIQDQLGYNEDFLKKASLLYGDLIIGTLYAAKCLPLDLAEFYLSSLIKECVAQNDLEKAKFVEKILLKEFPFNYKTHLSNEINTLNKKLETNLKDPEIIFLEDPQIDSLHQLLKLFKGKVVYLNIWGSWCGPCKHELSQHTQALKNYFSTAENLVFVYLAMEKPEYMDIWKSFIGLHKLKGIHLAKNEKQMEVFWENLLGSKDGPRYYPTYAIFDQKGNLVTNKAPRPSDGEKLYKKLEQLF